MPLRSREIFRRPRAEGSFSGALRQGKLPPKPLDACGAALVLDRLPKFFADVFDLVGIVRSVVAYGCEAEKISWKLRAGRVKNEGPSHPENSAEKPCFENDIIPRRRLTRVRCRRTHGCPVILSKHECGEVYLSCQLDETLQCGNSGIEYRGPGFHPRELL